MAMLQGEEHDYILKNAALFARVFLNLVMISAV